MDPVELRAGPGGGGVLQRVGHEAAQRPGLGGSGDEVRRERLGAEHLHQAVRERQGQQEAFRGEIRLGEDGEGDRGTPGETGARPSGQPASLPEEGERVQEGRVRRADQQEVRQPEHPEGGPQDEATDPEPCGAAQQALQHERPRDVPFLRVWGIGRVGL